MEQLNITKPSFAEMPVRASDIKLIGFEGFYYEHIPGAPYTLHDTQFFTCFGVTYMYIYDQHEIVKDNGYDSHLDITIDDLIVEIIYSRKDWLEMKEWEDEDLERFNKLSGLVTLKNS